MIVDVVADLFGAHGRELLELARVVDASPVGALWVTDHFSGAVVGAPWSRDPFVTLGAMAVVTERVELGLLVANVTNRHPVQLACAVNSLQSLAPSRVRLGVGSGAVPGSRFAIEHDAIGRPPSADTTQRREHLRRQIRLLRALWAGESYLDDELVDGDLLSAVIDAAAVPSIIVGASGWATVEVAIDEADGVNLRVTAALPDHLRRIRSTAPPGFEVSVLAGPEGMASDDLDRLAAAGVDRVMLTIAAPGQIASLPIASRRA